MTWVMPVPRRPLAARSPLRAAMVRIYDPVQRSHPKLREFAAVAA